MRCFDKEVHDERLLMMYLRKVVPQNHGRETSASFSYQNSTIRNLDIKVSQNLPIDL